MRSRPMTFIALTTLLGSMIISSIAVLMINGINPLALSNGVIPMIFVGLGILLTSAAYGTWRPRPWGFALLGATVITVLTLDAMTLWKSKQLTPYYIPDIMLILTGAIALAQPKLRRAFFDASIRWWERAKRYALGAKSYIITEGGNKNSAVILDISQSGCLIKSKGSYHVGDVITLEMTPELHLKGTVVRHKSIQEFGLKFEIKNRNELKKLNQFLKTNSTANIDDTKTNDHQGPDIKAA